MLLLLGETVLAIWPVAYVLVLPQAAVFMRQSHAVVWTDARNDSKPTLIQPWQNHFK